MLDQRERRCNTGHHGQLKGGDASYIKITCVAEAYFCVCTVHHIMELSTVLFKINLLLKCLCVCASVLPSPRMELPPLSPGIHDNVIDVVVVFVTVRRGWSGGTEEKAKFISWLVALNCLMPL